MLECLEALDGELRARGGRLVVRRGRPQTEVRAVAAEVGARAVHVSDDVTGFARARDARVEQALARDGVALVRHPGLYVADLPRIRTGSGGPYTVYSPFLKAWKAQERRPVERAPREIAMARIAAGRMPSLRALGFAGRAPGLEDRPEPGEDAARRAARAWVDGQGLARYAERRNDLAVPTSRLSAYLRFGCLSPLGLERAVAARRMRALPRPARLARLLRRRGAPLPPHRARRVPGALPRPRMGRRRRAARRLARGPARASPSSTPPCASSPRRAGCTTARA